MNRTLPIALLLLLVAACGRSDASNDETWSEATDQLVNAVSSSDELTLEERLQGEEPEAFVDPIAEMQARYRPGPYVQLEALVPAAEDRMEEEAAPGRPIVAGADHAFTPWTVYGAVARTTAPPRPSDSPQSPTLVVHAPQSITVVPRVPIPLPVQISDIDGSGDIVEVVVMFEGYEGTHFLPVMLDTESPLPDGKDGRVDVVFAISAAQLPNPGGVADRSFSVNARLAALDRAGNLSPWATQPLTIEPVSDGDVEVTLSMSAATDLDLYVTSPTGQTIYYGNRNDGAGGGLDLDANAACGSNLGVTSEHVFWPDGRAPAGAYTVRVAHWESCIGGAPLDYSITVHNCGEIATFTGTFTGRGDSATCTRDPGTDENWCQQVVSFDVLPCDKERT